MCWAAPVHASRFLRYFDVVHPVSSSAAQAVAEARAAQKELAMSTDEDVVYAGELEANFDLHFLIERCSECVVGVHSLPCWPH